VKLASEDLGFQPARLTTFTMPLKPISHIEPWDRIMADARTISGVSNVAIVSSLPFETPSWMPRVQPAEYTSELSTAGIPGYIVTPTFFETAGIRLIHGRAFDQSDGPASRLVAIVNRAFASSMLANRNPIGAQLRIADDGAGGGLLEVVGVVDDVVQARVEDGMAPAIYVSYRQSSRVGRPRDVTNAVVAANRAMNADAVAAELRRAMRHWGLPLLGLESMAERVEATRIGPRFHAMLIGAFAASAILLSAIGLYGTLAFAVRSRKKELGIRIALGAAPQQIHRIVVGQGSAIFAIGGVAGLLGALGVTRLLRGFLYQLSPIDPISFGMAVVGIGLVVVLAALGPAIRAGRIDPMTSIRADD
jgi:putative ABC transport system permease protein